MADYQLTETDKIIVGMVVKDITPDNRQDYLQIHRAVLGDLGPKADAINRSVAMHQAVLDAIGQETTDGV